MAGTINGQLQSRSWSKRGILEYAYAAVRFRSIPTCESSGEAARLGAVCGRGRLTDCHGWLTRVRARYYHHENYLEPRNHPYYSGSVRFLSSPGRFGIFADDIQRRTPLGKSHSGGNPGAP